MAFSAGLGKGAAADPTVWAFRAGASAPRRFSRPRSTRSALWRVRWTPPAWRSRRSAVRATGCASSTTRGACWRSLRSAGRRRTGLSCSASCRASCTTSPRCVTAARRWRVSRSSARSIRNTMARPLTLTPSPTRRSSKSPGGRCARWAGTARSISIRRSRSSARFRSGLCVAGGQPSPLRDEQLRLRVGGRSAQGLPRPGVRPRPRRPSSGYKEGTLSRSVVPDESRHWKGALSGKMLSSPSWEVLHVAGHCDRPDITSRACPLPHRLAASETRDLTPGGVSGAARSRREAARGHLGPRSVVPPR